MNGITRKEGILTCGEKLLAILGIALLRTGIWMFSYGRMVKVLSVGIEYVKADQSIQSGSIGIISHDTDIAENQKSQALQAPEKCKVSVSLEDLKPCPVQQKDIWRAVEIKDRKIISGEPIKRPLVEDLNLRLSSTAQKIYRQIEKRAETKQRGSSLQNICSSTEKQNG